MAISVAATGNNTVSASRSPAVTFSSYTPQLNDCVVLISTSGAAAGAVTAQSGWGSFGAVASDSHTGAAAYHFVTAAEVSAVTTTYTATNFWNASITGNVCGIVLRGVDPDIQWDDFATGFSSANAATPHVIPAIAGTDILANSMVVAGICKDGAAGTWTTPTGWTARGTNTTNVSTVLYTRDALTTAATGTSSVNVTPNSGDEYVAFAIAFTESPTAGPKTSTLTDDFSSLNTTLWDATGSATATGGQASIPPGGSLDTDITYDLTSSAFSIEVPNPATSNATETWVALNRFKAAYTYYGLYFRIFQGNIYFGEYDLGVADETSLAYDSTNHRWLKLSESGGTITWATSPDGSTWTSRRTKTAGFAVLTNFYVGLKVVSNGTIFTDSFTRADSTTSPGPGWTNRNGTPGVKGNQFYNSNTGTGNQAQTATATTTPSGNDARVSARCSQAASESNLLLNSSSTKTVAIAVPGNIIRTTTDWGLGGNQTTRATLTGTHTDGDLYTLEQVGTLFTAYRNGASIGTWDDTGGYIPRTSTQRNAGLHIYHSVASDVGRWDDFTLEDLSLTASTVVMDNLNGVPGFTGTSVAKVSVLGAAASGAQTQTGTSVVVLRSIAAAAAGAMAPSGAAASALQILTASASGAQAQIGTSASVLQRLVAAAAGTQTQTGTSAAALQRLVAAAAGQMEPSGTSATTLQKLVAASSGAQEQTGTSAAALRALTASAAGAMDPVGVGAATLQSLVAAASGTQTQTGTSATTLQRLVAAAAGVMPPSGTGSATLSALTAAAAGAQAQTGTSQAAIQKLVASASGVMAPSGVSDVALRALTVVAAGIQEQSGVAAAVLRALTASASGAMTPSGAGAASLQPLVATAAGAQAQTGTSASALPALTAAALGAMAPSGTSDAALRALVAAAAGEALGTGTGVVSLRPLAAAASGEQKLTGTAAAALRALTASALGAQTFTGTSASVLQKLVAAASGEQKVTGTSAASLQALVAAAAGAQTQTGTAAAALRVLTAAAAGELAANIATAVLTPPQASATGSQPSDGTSGAVLHKLVAAATGAQPFSGSAEATLRAVQAGAGGMVMNSDFSAVRMLIVAREDRTLVVAVAERELNVGAANRTTVIVADDRTVIWAAEGREVEAVTEAREFIVEGMHDDLEVNTEDRSVIIGKSDRETVVAVEDRTYRVPAEDRTVRWTADELLVVDP